MALKSVSDILRARLWDAVYGRVEQEQRKENLRTTLGSSWRQLYRNYCVKRLGRFADELALTRIISYPPAVRYLNTEPMQRF